MFLLLPIKTDCRLRIFPWANWLLIAANILVYFLETAGKMQVFHNWGLNSRQPELHQFVSYAFMHEGLWHIAGNMLFLYIFGNNICDRLGNIAYLGFYLAGAVFSGIGYTAINQTGIVIGASGAVAAVTGAYLALLPRSHVTLFYWAFILIGFYELPSLWVIGAFFIQDVFYSFSTNTGVAYIAHVSGTLFGFIISLVLLKVKLLPRDHFDMLALIDRWNRRRQYQSVINEGCDHFGYIPPKVETKATTNSIDQTQDLRAQISAAMAHGDPDTAVKLYMQLRVFDPNQTLARGAQLDVSNHLFSTQDYANAVIGYEMYLKSYGTSEQAGQVYLMLGMAYSRYLNQQERARECLLAAVRLLHSNKEMEIARRELMQLGGDSV